MRRLNVAVYVVLGLAVSSAFVAFGKDAGLAEVLEKREKEFPVENKYLIMPIQNRGKRSAIQLSIDGKAVRQYDLSLAPSAELADWYAFFTIGNYKGKKARVEATTTEAGFALIRQSNTIPGEENFYKEPHRPQFHFTQKVGWNNDPNGLVYHDGKWHLFFQHNPVGLGWGNMTWGHAVSKDLLHWEQQADVLFPKTMAVGDCYSGSAVVDKKNTAGWGENTLVAFFTDTGCGEAIAYSTDGGDTFTYYEKNPVVKHGGRDPKIIWYAYGKQDEPLDDKAKELGGHWVMVVYDNKGGNNAAFYTSTNLKDWTEQSHFPGYSECPDLIKLRVDGDADNTRWVVYGADAAYAVGQFDGRKFTPEHEGKRQVHFGMYFAAQTFANAPDGRTIQMGWIKVPAPGPYNQHFSFPHCLTLRKTDDGIRMFATPIKEIETLRVKSNKAEPQKLAAGKPVDLPVGSDLLDIRLAVEVGNAEAIRLNVAGRIVKYDVKTKILDLDMLTPVVSRQSKRFQGAPLPPVGGRIDLQILADRTILEIIGNGGRVYVSAAGPGTKVDVNKVSIMATGGEAKLVEFEAHELKSIWNTGAVKQVKAPAAKTTPVDGRLLPSPKDAGFRMKGFYVWGGSIIKADGRFHMFASRWPEGTGRGTGVEMLAGYRQHSEIVHAVADDAIGPYEFKEVVLKGRGGKWWDGQMCHNPKIVRIGDTYVLFYIGSAVGSPLRKIGYAWSKSVAGPWTRIDECLPLGEDQNNPAPYVHEDGRILLAFRVRGLRIDIAAADAWNGTYRTIAENICPEARLEDPDLAFRDGLYHLIAEDCYGTLTGHTRFGAHLVSKDGTQWEKHDPVEAYTHTIQWADGTQTKVDRRERPELFNANADRKGTGQPTHLVTGVQVGERTWCHVQRIAPSNKEPTQ